MTKRVAWFTCEPDVKDTHTPYKVYEVFNEKGNLFTIINDKGFENFCLKKGCSHLNGKDWVFADVVEQTEKQEIVEEAVVPTKKTKKWSKWYEHTTGNVPKHLSEDDIVKVKLRGLPKGKPFAVGAGCWVECGDCTIMKYKVKLT